MHQIPLGGGYTPTKAAGAPLGYFLVLRRFNHGEKISKADFRDLSEKKTVFIEFLEIIQNKNEMLNF